VRGYDRFAEVYSRFHGPLWRYLAKLGADRELALDLTQETFIRWWNSRAAEWTDERARPYLYTTASRLLIDWHRRAGRQRAFELDAAQEETVEPATLLIDTRAWAALTTRDRQLLWLAYAEEFSHEEIALICGLATKSIKVLLHRARSRIAALLKEAETVHG
jgi:RNA polymerase sigma-70 factor (ECF subfamily)